MGVARRPGGPEVYADMDRYAHREATVVATVAEVRIVFENKLIARHRRDWGREQTHFDPVHYLALLERKPGGFDVAKPLEQWDLPACFGLLRRRLEADDRQGRPGYILVLRLLETHSLAQLTDAVESALAIGVEDPDSIRSVLDHRAGRTVEGAFVDQGYTGADAADQAQAHGIRLEVVKHTEAKKGFVLLPRRWVVERSLGRFRRLAETLAGWHGLVFLI